MEASQGSFTGQVPNIDGIHLSWLVPPSITSIPEGGLPPSDEIIIIAKNEKNQEGKKFTILPSQLKPVKALLARFEFDKSTKPIIDNNPRGVEIVIDNDPRTVEIVIELLKQISSSTSLEDPWKGFVQTLQDRTFFEIYELFNFAEFHCFEDLKLRLKNHIFDKSFFPKFLSARLLDSDHANECNYHRFLDELKFYFLLDSNQLDPFETFKELEGFLNNFINDYGYNYLLELFNSFQIPKVFLFPLIAALLGPVSQTQTKSRVSKRVNLAIQILSKFDSELTETLHSQQGYLHVYYSIFAIAKNLQSIPQFNNFISFMHERSITDHCLLIPTYLLGLCSLLSKEEIEVKDLMQEFVKILFSSRPQESSPISILAALFFYLRGAYDNAFDMTSPLGVRGKFIICETFLHLKDSPILKEIFGSEVLSQWQMIPSAEELERFQKHYPNERERIAAVKEADCNQLIDLPNSLTTSTEDQKMTAEEDRIVKFLEDKKKFKALKHFCRLLKQNSYHPSDFFFEKIVKTLGAIPAFRFAKKLPEPYKVNFFEYIFKREDDDDLIIKLLVELKEEGIEKSVFLIDQFSRVAAKLLTNDREEDARAVIEQHILEILGLESSKNKKLPQSKNVQDLLALLLKNDALILAEKLILPLSVVKKYYLPYTLALRVKQRKEIFFGQFSLSDHQLVFAFSRALKICEVNHRMLAQRLSQTTIDALKGMTERAISSISARSLRNLNDISPFLKISRRRYETFKIQKKELYLFYAKLYLATVRKGNFAEAHQFKDGHLLFISLPGKLKRRVMIKKYQATQANESINKKCAEIFYNTLLMGEMTRKEIREFDEAETTTPGLLSYILNAIKDHIVDTSFLLNSFLFNYLDEIRNRSFPKALSLMVGVRCSLFDGVIAQRLSTLIPSRQKKEGIEDSLLRKRTREESISESSQEVSSSSKDGKEKEKEKDPDSYERKRKRR
jgi:hypothetical protein